jgi:hypothetical protein
MVLRNIVAKQALLYNWVVIKAMFVCTMKHRIGCEMIKMKMVLPM